MSVAPAHDRLEHERRSVSIWIARREAKVRRDVVNGTII